MIKIDNKLFCYSYLVFERMKHRPETVSEKVSPSLSGKFINRTEKIVEDPKNRINLGVTWERYRMYRNKIWREQIEVEIGNDRIVKAWFKNILDIQRRALDTDYYLAFLKIPGLTNKKFKYYLKNHPEVSSLFIKFIDTFMQLLNKFEKFEKPLLAKLSEEYMKNYEKSQESFLNLLNEITFKEKMELIFNKYREKSKKLDDAIVKLYKEYIEKMKMKMKEIVQNETAKSTELMKAYKIYIDRLKNFKRRGGKVEDLEFKGPKVTALLPYFSFTKYRIRDIWRYLANKPNIFSLPLLQAANKELRHHLLIITDTKKIYLVRK